MIISILVLSLSFISFAQQKPTIAVLDFEGLGVPDVEAKALTNRLRSVLVQRDIYRVVERGKMDEILKEQGFQLSGCTSEECVVEVGQLLGVQKMLAGSISIVGKTYSVEMRIIDVELGRIEKSSTYDFRGEIDQLLLTGMNNALNILNKTDAVYQTDKSLFTPLEEITYNKRDTVIIKNEIPGLLTLEIEPPDVNVHIDNKDLTGQSKIELTAGQYNIEIKKDGYETKSERIIIESGKITNKMFTLKKQIDISLYSKESIIENIISNMVKIEDGTFLMGSNSGDADEKPEHQITVDVYYICKYEVTQIEWQLITGYNPSYFKGELLPVENISWYQAIDFCNKLSVETGLVPFYTIINNKITYNMTSNGFRLLTEAEWEYASKGGNKSKNFKYSGGNDIDSTSWYCNNSKNTTKQVGLKIPNELGLYDMNGNVWEWVNDWYKKYEIPDEKIINDKYSELYKICRGGSWSDNAFNCRIANRNYKNPSQMSKFLGLRLCRSAE